MPKGKPWYRIHSKNAQSQFGNWWATLLERVRKKHTDFPKLLPNILRREYSDEVASLALQHGKLSGDDLLKCYANLPLSKVVSLNGPTATIPLTMSAPARLNNHRL
jgi:hypothetical protein